jgi:hypothetical protein
VVKGLHALIDPLAPMLPGTGECFAIQLARIGAEDLAAQPLDRLDLDPLRAAQPAGRLDRAHVTLERLGTASASSSGPAASLERGSARSSGE